MLAVATIPSHCPGLNATMRIMKPNSAPAHTTSLPLDDTLARIAKHELVEGILLLGSTGTKAFTNTSDYDVLVVFSTLSAPLRIVNTWISGRLAEIYCTTNETIERVANTKKPWLDSSEEATILGWLKTGRIQFDRLSMLTSAQASVTDSPAPELPGDYAIYEAWRKIGYNVAQIKRYLVADDPQSQMAVDLRLLYSVDEVKIHYFTVRRLPWRGEKPAILHWMEHDVNFLNHLRQYFDEPNRHRRVALYEELARLSLAPIAELWGFGETAISLGAGYGVRHAMDNLSADEALALWRALVAHNSND